MKKQQQIEKDLIDQIERGVFYPGDRIPTIRSTAKAYGVSITPVTEAYVHLTEQRILVHKPNVGYFVSEYIRTNSELKINYTSSRASKNDELEPEKDSIMDYKDQFFQKTDMEFDYPWGATAICSGLVGDAEIGEFLEREFTLSLVPHNPQCDTHDDLKLVHSIVKLMAGAGCSPAEDEISIVSSATSGLESALFVCTRENKIVAVETPGHSSFYFLAIALGLQCVSVPSDEYTGLKVNHFKAMLEYGIRPACLVLSSIYSSPTGALMPEENKIELVKLCREYNIPIIEDDVLGEIYYGNTRHKPLKAYDPENVIYISGFSKTISPCLRLGWTAGGRFKEELYLRKHLRMTFTSTEVQRAFAGYLESPKYSRYMNSLRGLAKKNVLDYTQVIKESFPKGTEVVEPKGGIFLWVKLPGNIPVSEICASLLNSGFLLQSGNAFSMDKSMFENCMRFNVLSMPWTRENRKTLANLGAYIIRNYCE